MLLSFLAACQPLGEVIALWDFLFAAGFHMIVPVCAAVLLRKRDELLASTSPGNLLHVNVLRLDSGREIAAEALQIARRLDDPLYGHICNHMTS